MTIQLSELEVFLAAVETGSFSAAGRRLDLSPSAVSKLVSRLEDRLAVRLFHRTPRMLTPTDAGRVLYDEGQDIFAALSSAENAVLSCSGTISGTLRVHSMVSFAKHQLVPVIGEFLARYPKLRVEFHLTNEPVDFVEQRIDVSIQGGPLPDSSLVARRLLDSPWIICAAPSYLARHGTPQTPDDLAHHNCINFSHRADWNLWPVMQDGAPRTVAARGNLGANQGDMLLALARHGLGLVRLARFHVDDDLAAGLLVPVLAAFQPAGQEPLYLAWQSRKHLSPRVRAFLDYMQEKFTAAARPETRHADHRPAVRPAG
ncbi:LysR family transcriptional regulator [Pseudoduganella sp. SL102]|uniref:LysR family transcriptional regulator n=1 Tax=Pseudoduganella sp. SL102 TaxID=2995154 RepID=UPI00248CDFAE|nr:LysR family transcriptional regulator [Pseudoduganella sp. SL102]WBS03710.1 LysR family transcriptional regulator [Pseudoduganella sp. SL102]